MKKLLSFLSIAMASMTAVMAETVQSSDMEDDGISQKWEVKAMVGGMLTNSEDGGHAKITNWGESLQFEVGAGYNLSSNLYVGLSSGYFYKYGFTMKAHQENQLVPLLGDVVYRWNKWRKWSLFAEARAGYLMNFQSEVKLADGTTYEPAGYTLFELMPGVYYRLRDNIDLRVSVGYTYGATAEEGVSRMTQNETGLVAKVGMNFRKAPKAMVRTAVVEDVPAVVETPVVVEEPVKAPEPAPVVVPAEPEQKKLSEREVVIYYVKRMHDILPDKAALLQEMVEFVKTHKTGRIVLKSYADKGTGNYQLNQMYSRNRMEEVQKYLIERYGLSADQIEASYYGDTVQPFEENDLNRCSIITVKEVE